MTTTRLKPAERKVFRQLYGGKYSFAPNEPALGTLDERLDIIRRRFGPTVIRLTAAEKAQLATARLPVAA